MAILTASKDTAFPHNGPYFKSYTGLVFRQSCIKMLDKKSFGLFANDYVLVSRIPNVTDQARNISKGLVELIWEVIANLRKAAAEFEKVRNGVVYSTLCDARVTQILPTLPKVTLLTVQCC